MDAFSFDMPEKIDTGNFLETPGTYHVIIGEVSGTTSKGEPIDGMRVTCAVLEGTVRDSKNVCTEVSKQTDVTIWKPKLSDTDEQQKRSANALARFFLATGLASEADLGKAGLKINPSDAAGRQIVVKLVKPTDKEGKESKFLRCWGDFWHVDDPAVASVPKCAKSLDLIPKSQRRATVDPKPAKKGKKAAEAATEPAALPPAKEPEVVNCDDI